MAFAFDTLGYAKRLRDAGVAGQQAEADAEAASEFIMTELVTKADLLVVRSEFQAAIETQTLRLTVRLGGIIAAGFGVMAASIGVLAILLRTR